MDKHPEDNHSFNAIIQKEIENVKSNRYMTNEEKKAKVQELLNLITPNK